MGGRPLTALAIAAFPNEGLEPGTIREVFRGGFDKLREAGVSLLGGHTVQDPEIKFGYAVTGAIDPARVLTNAGAKAGDVVFLTKPLGTGIVGTAIKFERAAPALIDEAVRSMTTLNRAAAEALERLPAGAVHACTDITGFGLLGHATEVARASGVTIAIHGGRAPMFAGVADMAMENQSGGLGSNLEHFGGGVRIEYAWPVDLERPLPSKTITLMSLIPVMYDPQTSGGLLVTVDPSAADQTEQTLLAHGVAAARIGTVEPARPNVHVVVRP